MNEKYRDWIKDPWGNYIDLNDEFMKRVIPDDYGFNLKPYQKFQKQSGPKELVSQFPCIVSFHTAVDRSYVEKLIRSYLPAELRDFCRDLNYYGNPRDLRYLHLAENDMYFASNPSHVTKRGIKYKNISSDLSLIHISEPTRPY